MPKYNLPIGNSDFKDVRQSGLYYIDKSLLIEELMASSKGDKVVLLPRPRRFGKTLNLSMLHYFFDCTENNAELFNGLAITQSTAWQYQGQYPVLFLTLKDCKAPSWQRMQFKLADAIGYMCEPYRFLLQEGVLHPHEQTQLTALLNRTAPIDYLENSLKVLTNILYRYYQKQVVVLVDEYDSPLIEAYNQGYYPETLATVRNMLSEALKDNKYLVKGVITGILRVAKESIFSGLNNLVVGTVLDRYCNRWFGLSPDEVKQALGHFELASHYADIEAWYNGYLFGGQAVYNPWSIISYLRRPDKGFVPHWVNTSDNKIIGQLLGSAHNGTIQKIEALIQGQTVEATLEEHTVFADLEQAREESLLSFLVFSGYLKAQFLRQEIDLMYYRLEIPNVEVLSVYKLLLRPYLELPATKDISLTMLQNLLAGQTEALEAALQRYVLAAFSYYDVAEPQAERIYHGFMLGVLAFLHTTHQVLSNRETGLGRADMLLLPREAADNRAYVLEFKQAPTPEQLEATATAALQQISNKRYPTLIHDAGKTQTHHYAIAFCGKQLTVKSK